MNLTNFFNENFIITYAKYIKGVLFFLIFISVSWIAITILKRILGRHVFRPNSEHLKRMGTFLLLGMLLYATKIALLSIFPERKILLGVESLAIFLLSIGVVNMIDGLISRMTRNVKIADFRESTIVLSKRISEIIVWFICFTLILKIWGIEIGPLLAGFGIAGITMGLALQTTLTDLFSGLAMTLDRTFRIGNVVQIGDVFGEVYEITFRSVKIKTYANEIVAISNSKAASNNVINYSKLKPRRVTILMRIAYGSDVNKMKKVCLETVRKVAEELKRENKSQDVILNEPSPAVFLTDLSDYSLNFKVFAWVNEQSFVFENEEKLKTALYNAVNSAEGISFALPTQIIRMKEKI
ncbi:MAG: mechanosensitive ion channel family protein [Candidatus Woesearchaeota archaeon]|nr:mechanosensitive ion channel family protein [Candidatus Woesearchaeota archaeon]